MTPNFLFISAENDALSQCKAGGMGDVVRDVPLQIASKGHRVSTVVPSYGRLHKNAKLIGEYTFQFRGNPYTVQFYKATPKNPDNAINHFVIHHPELTEGNIAHIYQHDNDEPFKSDSNKFALFCTAVAHLIQQQCFGKLDVVHLHDWHTTLLLFLKEFHPDYQKLKTIRFVYSIHNLAIQGIRPLDGNASSLKAWFPELNINPFMVKDTRYQDCINLMGIGIRYADAVHTVSPTYKHDILLPSEPPFFIGGEGLEYELQKAETDQRLFGILNGIYYESLIPEKNAKFYDKTLHAIFDWLSDETKKYKSDFLIHTGRKISTYKMQKPSFIVASVARLTEQKFYFFKEFPEIFKNMLTDLKKAKGIYMLLGTGDPAYEAFFREISYQHHNFVFINGQSEVVVQSLYNICNLYLMPSLFEPCGISQMLSMRCGNPCLAHNTGGLKDTIGHQINGFTFDGKTSYQKAYNMRKALQEILHIYFNCKDEWNEIKANAKASRFSWEDAVNDYYRYLYKIPTSSPVIPKNDDLEQKILTS